MSRLISHNKKKSSQGGLVQGSLVLVDRLCLLEGEYFSDALHLVDNYLDVYI